MKTSLTRDLIQKTTLTTALLLMISGALLHSSVHYNLLSRFDARLEERAKTLSSAIEIEHGHLELDFDDLDMTDFRKGGSWFYQLENAAGKVFSRSPSTRHLKWDTKSMTKDSAGQWQQLSSGFPIRAKTLHFSPKREHRRTAPQSFYLTIGKSSRQLSETLRTFQLSLLAVGAGTLLVIMLTLQFTVRKGLATLTDASSVIELIGQDSDLSRRINVKVPLELSSFIDHINDLLKRIESMMEREKSFSNEVSHELRTPLAGLRTILEVSKAQQRSPDELQSSLDKSLSIVIQLEGMVERLLQLARLEADLVPLSYQRIVLSDALLDVWEALSTSAEERTLTVTWQLDPHLEWECDPQLLQVILRNLCHNAIAHNETGGSLDIESYPSASNQEITILFRNSGSSLDPGSLQHATKKFWRGEVSRTGTGLHCGLGLSLVQRAVNTLGGRLELSSEDGFFEARVHFPNQ